MKPIKDFVLIKPHLREETSGLYIDHTYEPSDHVLVIGTVVEIPMKLDKEPWQSEIEIQVGDVVYFDRYSAMQAFGNTYHGESITNDNRVIKVDEIPHLYLKYHNLYMAIREGKRIMLNGYALLTSVEWKAKSNIELVQDVTSHYKIFKAELSGKSIKYSNPDYEDSEISGGKYYVIDTARGQNSRVQNHVFPVEQFLYRTLDKEYYVAQRCYISAEVSEDVVTENIAKL